MELAAIHQQVIELSLEVGAFIKKEGDAFDANRIEQKTEFNNLVSYVDKEAEKRIVSVLQKLLPEAGFITEEGTVQQSTKQEYNWIIDPLDGTTNFLHGLPIFAISIGLTKGTEVISGVVYHIGTNECFHAFKGSAAFCNQQEIHVTQTPSLQQSLLATGFPYHNSNKSDVYLEIIKNFLAKTHGIRRLGSAAIDLAYVACGRLEGFFEYNLNPWDVAAGALIVKQAGGIVTDFKGGNDFLFGKELCAANALMHGEMLHEIKSRWSN
jgi:myo-inositol-1(or 4)-monophosphatase